MENCSGTSFQFFPRGLGGGGVFRLIPVVFIYFIRARVPKKKRPLAGQEKPSMDLTSLKPSSEPANRKGHSKKKLGPKIGHHHY